MVCSHGPDRQPLTHSSCDPLACHVATMPRKGNRKRLKYRADDVSSHRVTVADYANSDPAVVKSGRIKKAVANAVQKEVKALCGLEASQVPTEDGLSILSEDGQHYGSNDELEDSETQNGISREKKSKKYKEITNADRAGGDYPFDIWLVLANYIRPENVVTFALICKKAWTVTCTAVFWMRLYKRYYRTSTYLPVRLLPECMYRLRSLRACVIRSLYHMYEPFSSRVAKNPALPESTPSTLLNSNPLKQKNHCVNGLQPPAEYKEVHYNPDQECCLLQITTLNFIFIPVVMGMTLTYLTINVSTDMRHHRVRLVFHDCPVLNRKRPRGEQGVQIVLDPVHSVHLLDWWHPKYPFSIKA
ncbi:PREDICTED: transmembrane protein 183-like isoform X2 [Nanorana parkeri]|uniref:transmembrane protein 183-like isoform X2 n=1 Tax=Nanorana parkeri TaxID=125878 RepID=UPI000854CC71|nr:PREDICTED: transmembrane protein 183-like isoform X2 [Nanorana parkeri]